jgi:Tol biopolymer transport system component
VWSPDGAWLAFSDSSSAEQAGLWIARAEGETAEERDDRYLGLGGNPVWSSDGHWLAFQSVGEDGLLTYVTLNVEIWERRTLNLAVGRYSQLMDWIRLLSR